MIRIAQVLHSGAPSTWHIVPQQGGEAVSGEWEKFCAEVRARGAKIGPYCYSVKNSEALAQACREDPAVLEGLQNFLGTALNIFRSF